MTAHAGIQNLIGEAYAPDKVREIHAHLANLLSKLYPSVGRDEIKQELWAAYYASPFHQDGQEGTEDDYRMLRKLMRRGAERYCRKEKAAQAGYETHDEAFYSLSALRELLEAWFAHGPQESPPRTYESSVTRSEGDASQGGGWLVSLLDVGDALRRLAPAQKEVLYYAYSPEYAGRTDSEIAIELSSKGWKGMTEEKFKGKVSWALNRLQRHLGGQNPWKGG